MLHHLILEVDEHDGELKWEKKESTDSEKALIAAVELIRERATKRKGKDSSEEEAECSEKNRKTT